MTKNFLGCNFMELYQLQCFYEAAQAQNITKAALKMKISQPALSKTINRLEEDLGVKLFDRRAKSIVLNEYGQAVLKKTEEIFAAMDDIRLNIEDIKAGSIGEIKIGSTLPSAETSWLLDCIRDFLMENPKATVIQHQMGPDSLRRAVMENEVEIAIGGRFLADPELDWTELYSQRLGVAVSESSPFAGRESVSVGELREEIFLCNNSNADMETLTWDICERAGFTPNVALTSNYSNLIGELVSLGRGITIIPEHLFQDQSAANPLPWARKIVMIPLEEDYCVLHGVAAISRSRYVHSAARNLYARIVQSATSQ